MKSEDLQEVTIRSNGDVVWDWEVTTQDANVRVFTTTDSGDIVEVKDDQKTEIEKDGDDWTLLWRMTKMVPGDYQDTKQGSQWTLEFKKGHPYFIHGGAMSRKKAIRDLGRDAVRPE